MAKKTGFAKLLAKTGIWPLAPVLAARTGAQLNAASSIILGKDLENNFKGGGSRADAKGGTRFDVLDMWTQNTTMPLTEKLTSTIQAWYDHAAGTLTPLGFKRAAAPVIVTEIVYQVAKGMKANKIIPPEFRKFVKVY